MKVFVGGVVELDTQYEWWSHFQTRTIWKFLYSMTFTMKVWHNLGNQYFKGDKYLWFGRLSCHTFIGKSVQLAKPAAASAARRYPWPNSERVRSLRTQTGAATLLTLMHYFKRIGSRRLWTVELGRGHLNWIINWGNSRSTLYDNRVYTKQSFVSTVNFLNV